MIFRNVVVLSIAVLVVLLQNAKSDIVAASFGAPGTVPMTATAYSAVGRELTLNLEFAPQTGCDLTVVNVTGLDFIEGRFSNLAQGQEVQLGYNNLTYRFVANYYGGSGNDLVLHWASQELAVWGDNGGGQLGNDSKVRAYTPVGVAPPVSALEGRNVIAIASGASHSLALCSDGTLAAWGRDDFGQLGNGSEGANEIPRFVDRSGVLAGKTVSSIAAGTDHNLVLCSDGTLVAWGSNYGDQLGQPGYFYPGAATPIQVDQTGVLAGKTVVKIAAAGNYCLVLCSDGTLVTWGSGPLGNGPTPYSEQNSRYPVTVDQSGVLAGKTVVSISAGGRMNLTVCSDGTLASWGQNSYGELGNGISGIGFVSQVPVLVKQDGVLAGRQVVAAAAGAYHGLALCSDGTLAAWGYNSHGPLGNGTYATSNVPVAVDQTGMLAGKQVVKVLAGGYRSTVVCSDGSLAEWGDGLKNPAPAGFGVLEGKAVVSVVYGNGGSLALCSDGTLGKWESAGDLPVSIDIKPPVLQGKTIVSMAAGASHSHALCADGTLASWGEGYYGELGNGITGYGSRNKIYQTSGSGILSGKSVVAVAAGFNHSLALCSDGTLAAWGKNDNGALGDGTTTNRAFPVAVDQTGVLAGKTIVALQAGWNFSLVLCSDGTLYTWGRNGEGELGDATTTDQLTPVAVDRSGVLVGRSVIRISSKFGHSMALCADGSLVAWGLGTGGQLGNGANLDSKVPVAVDQTGILAGKSIVSIKTLRQGSLILCSDGTLFSWGRNAEGQLGDGGTLSSSLPVQVDQTGVLAGKSVVEIAAGSDHSVAVCADSTLAAWGYNTAGQLGVGIPYQDINRRPLLVDRTGFLSGKKVTSVIAGSNHNLSIAALSPMPLKNLTTSAGPLVFDQSVTSYSLSVVHETESVTFTPTYVAAASGVTILGLPVATGEASAPIPLAVGTNPIVVKVTGTDGSERNYSIQIVRRTQSWDSTLASLTVDHGSLDPEFTPKALTYDIEVADDVSTVQITAIPSNQKALLLLNDSPLGNPGNSAAVPVSFGTNEVRIGITSEDGVHFSTYTLRINRRSPDLAGLVASEGKLSPTFSTSITSYQLKVSNEVASTRITPECSNPAAILKVNGAGATSGSASGAIALKVGTSIVTVSVSDPTSLVSKTYSIQITRAASANATLSGLSITHAALNPSFKPKANDYSAKVAKSVRSVKITATAADTAASIQVNGVVVKSGGFTKPIPLAAGKNTIRVKVTAQNGSTNTYKITLTRAQVSKAVAGGENALVAAQASDGHAVSRHWSGGLTYLQIAAAKHDEGRRPLIEVSSNLVDWFSGNQYTAAIADNGDRMIIRDRTPLSTGKKRFIRLRWLAP